MNKYDYEISLKGALCYFVRNYKFLFCVVMVFCLMSVAITMVLNNVHNNNAIITDSIEQENLITLAQYDANIEKLLNQKELFEEYEKSYKDYMEGLPIYNADPNSILVLENTYLFITDLKKDLLIDYYITLLKSREIVEEVASALEISADEVLNTVFIIEDNDSFTIKIFGIDESNIIYKAELYKNIINKEVEKTINLFDDYNIYPVTGNCYKAKIEEVSDVIRAVDDKYVYITEELCHINELLEETQNDKKEYMENYNETYNKAPLFHHVFRNICLAVSCGVLVSFIYLFVKYTFEDTILSYTEFMLRTKEKVVGRVALSKIKNSLEEIVSSVEGRTKVTDIAECCSHVALYIINYLNNSDKILILGEDYNCLNVFSECLKIRFPNNPIYVGTDLFNDDSVKKALNECDSVLTLVEINKSKYSEVNGISQHISELKKKNLGCIIIE